MKAHCTVLLALLVIASPGNAASITVLDTSSNLSDVAATLTSILLDGGSVLKEISDGSFAVEIKDLHCDHYTRRAFDATDPHAALPSDKCRTNAKDLKGTKTGRVFEEARAIGDLLLRIQQSAGKDGPIVSDCAAGGYCGTFVKSIKCIINTKIDNFKDGGRWACTIIAGQP